nr:vesicular, overexpressed in cancer, prosurvival protein 1 isoform X1 [Dasypus novemcinctus]
MASHRPAEPCVQEAPGRVLFASEQRSEAGKPRHPSQPSQPAGAVGDRAHIGCFREWHRPRDCPEVPAWSTRVLDKPRRSACLVHQGPGQTTQKCLPGPPGVLGKPPRSACLVHLGSWQTAQKCLPGPPGSWQTTQKCLPGPPGSWTNSPGRATCHGGSLAAEPTAEPPIQGRFLLMMGVLFCCGAGFFIRRRMYPPPLIEEPAFSVSYTRQPPNSAPGAQQPGPPFYTDPRGLGLSPAGNPVAAALQAQPGSPHGSAAYPPPPSYCNTPPPPYEQVVKAK